MSYDRPTQENQGAIPRKPGHEPALAPQVIEILQPKPGMVCLDCTVGLGGHAAQIVPRLAPAGHYIGLDVDPKNIAATRERLADAPVPVTLRQTNFALATSVLDALRVRGVDLLLADLGFASNQVDDPARGLSFNADGPLDMRLDPRLHQTAADLVNKLPEEKLANLIYEYGQERWSRKIARKIVERRTESPINTTADLAGLVRRAYGPAGRRGNRRRRHKIDPATRTFMALRIAVNAELASLQQLLSDLPRCLRPQAVAVVISFHSLEDRLVKRAMADLCRHERAEGLTRKPVVADHEERFNNPRSRSAKLRAIRWMGNPAEHATGC